MSEFTWYNQRHQKGKRGAKYVAQPKWEKGGANSQFAKMIRELELIQARDFKSRDEILLAYAQFEQSLPQLKATDQHHMKEAIEYAKKETLEFWGKEFRGESNEVQPVPDPKRNVQFAPVQEPASEEYRPSGVNWKKKSKDTLEKKQEEEEEKKQTKPAGKQKPFVYYRVPPEVDSQATQPHSPSDPDHIENREQEEELCDKDLAREVLSLYSQKAEVLRDLFDLHKKSLRKGQIIKLGLGL